MIQCARRASGRYCFVLDQYAGFALLSRATQTHNPDSELISLFIVVHATYLAHRHDTLLFWPDRRPNPRTTLLEGSSQTSHLIDESILSTMKTIVKFQIKIVSGTIDLFCSIINYYLFIASEMSPMSPR